MVDLARHRFKHIRQDLQRALDVVFFFHMSFGMAFTFLLQRSRRFFTGLSGFIAMMRLKQCHGVKAVGRQLEGGSGGHARGRHVQFPARCFSSVCSIVPYPT